MIIPVTRDHVSAALDRAAFLRVTVLTDGFSALQTRDEVTVIYVCICERCPADHSLTAHRLYAEALRSAGFVVLNADTSAGVRVRQTRSLP